MTTYVAGDCEHVVRDPRHVTAHILAPIVDAGVAEGQKGGLDQLADAEGHGTGISGGDAELHVIEEVEIFEKRARVSEDLSNS